MVSFSSVLVVLCVSLCMVDAITLNPKPVMEMLQQHISKKSSPDCSTCNKPNQFCDYRSWTGLCKDCPVCGIDHFCDGHGMCKRCPGSYLKATQACERVDPTDPKSEGTYVEGKAVKLVFTTVGDSLFYLSAQPNVTDSTVAVPPPAPTNSSVPAPSGNTTTTTTTSPAREAISAVLSTIPSSHNIEEITEGSGKYRVSFNDSLGGYLHIIVPVDTNDNYEGNNGDLSLIDLKTLGVATVLRDFDQFTTFNLEHSASYSWRFRIGNDDHAKYIAWCGEATCGDGVPSLRLMSSFFCGGLTTSGIRCDIKITN